MVHAPVGYVTPPFPSIYWPFGTYRDEFKHAYLYYTSDVWKFTTIWAIILCAGLHTVAAACIAFTRWRKRRARTTLWICLAYIIWGAFNGFVAGSVIGVIIAALYNSTQFRVTTWIPFVWGVIILIYAIVSSYKFYIKII